MIFQHLKTSFVYLRRSPFQAMAAISVLGLTFFVATLIALLVYSSSQVLRDFETRPQVIAFLKKDAPTADGEALRDKLQNDTRLRDVKLVTKEEAVEIYKSATSDNPLLGELVSPSIFPASIEFSVTDLSFADKVIEEIKSETIVDNIGFTASLEGESSIDEVLTRLKSIAYYIRVGGLIAVAILAATSFLVLMVVISMRIQTRRSEIETLSLIGATRGFIRTPIIFEAINYAILGSIVGWIGALVLVLYSTPSILAYFGTIPVLPQDSLEFFGLLSLILLGEVIIALIIALMGSVAAVSRALGSK